MDRIDPSRWKDAWVAARRWWFGRELIYAVALTAVDFYVYVVVQHHGASSAPLDYLWAFLAAAAILGAVRFAFALATYPHRLLKQEVHDHLKDHTHSGSDAPAPPITPALDISPIPRGITAHFLDKASDQAKGVAPGFIYLITRFHVSAPPGNPHEMTVLRAGALIQLEDDDPVEVEGDPMWWFDEMVLSDERGHGLPVIPPGHTAELSYNFAFPAKPAEPGKDPVGRTYHFPSRGVIRLRIIDAQNTMHRARESTKFEVTNLADSL
jgi:hypothetical protein